MTLLIQKPTKKRKKPRPGNSEKHLAFIRTLPCLTGSADRPIEAHHLKATGARGGALRSPDMYAVPLSWMAHRGPHGVENVGSKNELDWFKRHGVADPLKVAELLWEHSGDYEMCEKIIISKGGYYG